MEGRVSAPDGTSVPWGSGGAQECWVRLQCRDVGLDWAQTWGGAVAGWWMMGCKGWAVAAPSPLGLPRRAFEPACIWGQKGKTRPESGLSLTRNYIFFSVSDKPAFLKKCLKMPLFSSPLSI